jgi:hypothetical protein
LPREGWRVLPQHPPPSSAVIDNALHFMVPIQPVSTRLNDEQRAKLNDLAEWLNWSESDVMRYCVLSVHEIVCQKPKAEIPVMIRMAREGRRNPVRLRKKQGGSP